MVMAKLLFIIPLVLHGGNPSSLKGKFNRAVAFCRAGYGSSETFRRANTHCVANDAGKLIMAGSGKRCVCSSTSAVFNTVLTVSSLVLLHRCAAQNPLSIYAFSNAVQI